MVNENVRGQDVYIVQPTCPPVNENLIELMLMVRRVHSLVLALVLVALTVSAAPPLSACQVSTMRRASARKITVVIPYYGYARQDRKVRLLAPSGGTRSPSACSSPCTLSSPPR